MASVSGVQKRDEKKEEGNEEGANWIPKVLKGEIRETRFATPERPGEQGPLVETSNLRFGLDKVSYMADQVRHPLPHAPSTNLLSLSSLPTPHFS